MSEQHGRTGSTSLDNRDALSGTRRGEEPLSGAERRVADRFARLHAATAALSAALTPAEVAAAIAARGVALPAASGCAVALLRPGGAIEIAAIRGAVDALAGGLVALPPDAPFPLARAADGRRAVFFAGGPSAWAALPLESGGQLLGALGVSFEGPLPFDDEERGFLHALAYQCAQALERARLYEADREARVAAERSEEAARRAMEREEQLLGIVGHDLRTPLAAIRMSTALLFRVGGLSDEQARTLARIGAAAVRMGRIIRDLLDFTRVRKEGALPLSKRLTDLGHLTRRAVAELSAVHPDREVIVDAPAPANVVGDPDRLLQVLTNLVGNALQHGPPEAPVRVAVRGEDGAALLRVHNEGPPIPAELQPQIFEAFRRGTDEEEGGSLGLGLFIVRELVRGHGGTVEVRSVEGEGTTFTVRLPAAPAGAEASEGRPATLESGGGEG